MNIRPFLASDEEACVAIFNSIDDDFFAQLKEEDYRRWILRSLNTDNHYYYAVEAEGEIVGCGGFLIKEEEEKEAIIAWGMVHPDQQKNGYGLALLDFRIDEIKKRMASGKIVTLDTTQQTYEFFEKKGFVVTKIQEGYHKKDLHRYDMELAY